MKNFTPLFRINDKGDYVNLMSVGNCKITSKITDVPANDFSPAHQRCEWTVSLTTYPNQQNVILTGSFAEKFIEKYTDK